MIELVLALITISIGLIILILVAYNNWKTHWKPPHIIFTIEGVHGLNPINTNRFLDYQIDYTIENQGSKPGLIKNFKKLRQTLKPPTNKLTIVPHTGIHTKLLKPKDSVFDSFPVDFRPQDDKALSLIRNLESASVTIEFEKETREGFEKEQKTIDLF